MIALSDQTKGIALILDFDGTIKKIRHNFVQPIDFSIGENMVNYIEESSIERFYKSLDEARNEGYSLGNEVILKTLTQPITTRLLMMDFENAIVLMSLCDEDTTLEVIDEILKINSEKTNLIRQSYEKASAKNKDQKSIEQISMLNSELINTQRTLAQKNKELERLNIKLKEISEMDVLTNVGNRRKFFQDFRAVDPKKSYKLIMLDFNNFKAINDDFGHKKGDETLKTFADYIIEKIHEYDNGTLYRIGGDEFVLLIETLKSFDVETFANDLNYEMGKIHKDLSIAYGVVEISASTHREGFDPEQLLNQADQIMYEKKRTQKKR